MTHDSGIKYKASNLLSVTSRVCFFFHYVFVHQNIKNNLIAQKKPTLPQLVNVAIIISFQDTHVFFKSLINCIYLLKKKKKISWCQFF